ncbi:MAG: class I SAM-dependent methyltransferase [Phycisphaerales bacterium]|nr:class I SAM-dependent methyltransferase [Phycisphaerales bacterium]
MGLKQTISKLYLKRFKKDLVFLDYNFNPKPRYLHGHIGLNEIVAKDEVAYKEILNAILKYSDYFLKVAKEGTVNSVHPYYFNGFFPALDFFALYTLVAELKPKTYFEIGSGTSTKIVKDAIVNHHLNTQIYSIDPYPRAEINDLVDKMERKRLQDFANFDFILSEISEGDILFFDGTHISAPNSDVTVFFLDILPKLPKGVIVQIHDIYLPYDYPQFMCDRYYNEQYLLAAFLLADVQRYVPLFPCFYIYNSGRFNQELSNVYADPYFNDVEKHGGSFWCKIN